MANEFVSFSARGWEEVIRGCCFQVPEAWEARLGEGVSDDSGLAELLARLTAQHETSTLRLLCSNIATQAVPRAWGAGRAKGSRCAFSAQLQYNSRSVVFLLISAFSQ